MDELITPSEAAEILEVSEKQVRNYVREGILLPVYPPGQKLNGQMYISREDVAGLAELQRSDVSLPKLAAIARRAHVASRSLERVVRRINAAVGADIPMADLSQDGVLSTYVKVEAALEEYRVRSADEVTEWSRLFFSIGEEYFGAVEQHTGDPEPWKKFLDLAARIRKEAPETFADAELRTAYDYFAVGARFMRQAAYFYVRNRYGLPVSNKLFPETSDDLVAPILAMAYD